MWFRRDKTAPGRIGGAFCLCLLVPNLLAEEAGLEFFEKEIRPLFIEHCHECHSTEASRPKANLYLDHKAGWEAGGDSGPALIPGKPEESLLMKAVGYEDPDLAMPPKYRLKQTEIAALERWIRMGAPDPRPKPGEARQKQTGLSLEEGRQFWSYRPVPEKVNPPETKEDWAWNRIDTFIRVRQVEQGIKPVKDADALTLLRRIHFDLTGLPPTPEQIRSFLEDPDPGAYERRIDGLLESPHFGERWGRHWLDLARFGESVTLRGFVFTEAWRYRDYVIDAFNRDLPYDQFLREQLAGDLMPSTTLEEDQRRLVATTFLTMGNANYEDQDKSNLEMDVVDEQLEVIGRSMLAQTIGCARCHDHKFDPIPTRDYYAMAGILKSTRMLDHANVSKWIEVPLPLAEDRAQQYRDREAALRKVESRLKSVREELARLKEPIQNPTPDQPAVLPASAFPGVTLDDQEARAVGEWTDSTYTKRYIGSGYRHDGNSAKGTKTLTFEPETLPPGLYEVRFAYTPGGNRSPNVPVSVFSADGEKTVVVDERKTPPIEWRFVSLGQFRFEKDGQAYVLVSNRETTGYVIADAVQFLPADQVEVVAEEPEPSPEKEAALAEEEALKKEQMASLEASIRRLQKRQKQLKAFLATRPMAMSVLEDKPGDIPIRVRGEVHNHGQVAPRGFLRVTLQDDPPPIPDDQSGRLQLANWIASPDNPLTARVMVNRIWHHLFGAGLVRTTDNFGTTGARPSHPLLLDHLARRFMEEGWSVKAMIRYIMLSRTYRLSSATRPEAESADPDNRLLWRMNRRRLDAESIRDAMLLVAGRLEHELGGATVPEGISSDYGQHYRGNRRSVYVPVLRNSLPELFEVFDFADPSVPTGRRNVSTVAPQALYLMNHPFVAEQARAAARRTLRESPSDWQHRVEKASLRALGRPPTQAEWTLARQFFGGQKEGDEDLWAQYYQVLFSTVDFRYLD